MEAREAEAESAMAIREVEGHSISTPIAARRRCAVTPLAAWLEDPRAPFGGTP